MKRVLTILALLGALLSGRPIWAQQKIDPGHTEKPAAPEKPAKPLTAKQRKAVIRQLRKDGKLKQLRVRVKGRENETALSENEEVMQIAITELPQPISVTLPAVAAPVEIDIAMELAKVNLTPLEIEAALITVDRLQLEDVFSKLATLPEPVQMEAIKTITVTQIETVLAQAAAMPEATQINVAKVIAQAPVETLSPALVNANPAIATLVLNQIPLPKIVDVASSLTGAVASNYIRLQNWDGLRAALEKAGVSQAMIEAFVQRLEEN